MPLRIAQHIHPSAHKPKAQLLSQLSHKLRIGVGFLAAQAMVDMSDDQSPLDLTGSRKTMQHNP